MPTKREIAAKIAALQKEHDSAPDDDDLELLVERDGIRTTLKGPHARRMLKRLGLDETDGADGDGGDDQDDGDGGDDQDDGDGGKKDAPPADGHRFFR